MKKILVISLASLAFCTVGAMADPESLTDAKQAVVRYHDSGKYMQEIAKTMDSATRYLKMQLADEIKNGKKPAIVLDIDETSLSNYDNMVKASFGGTLEQMQAAEMQGNDTVIAPTLKLYNFAKENNVAVFFITGRHEDERASTVANLQKAGFANWDGLIFKSAAYYQSKSAAIYKTAIRKDLATKGYDIILNIGDQKSDLAGGYARKTVKLPNPFYVIS